MAQIDDIARAWAHTWMEADSEAFADLFTPDAIYRDDQAGRVSRNRADLLDFHAHFAAALSEVRLTFTRIFQAGSDACLEWRFTGVQSGTFHGRPPSGIAFESEGVSVLTIASDGRIASCTDYYDGKRVAAQLAG